eukprot:294115-Pelagomonas_calceolata.AAC.15
MPGRKGTSSEAYSGGSEVLVQRWGRCSENQSQDLNFGRENGELGLHSSQCTILGCNNFDGRNKLSP